MSGDDDYDGDGLCGAEEQAETRTPVVTPKKKAKTAAAASKDAAPQQVGDMENANLATATNENVCNVCDKVIADEDLVMRGTSKVAMHRDCLNALVYLERHLRSSIGAPALARFRAEKPMEFKYKVLEFVTTDGGGPASKRRGAQDRAKAITLSEEISWYTKSARQQTILMLSERAFKQWPLGLCQIPQTLSLPGTSDAKKLALPAKGRARNMRAVFVLWVLIMCGPLRLRTSRNVPMRSLGGANAL